MKHLTEIEENEVTDLYGKIVGNSHKEQEYFQKGKFEEISGYAKEHYVTRTLSNLDNNIIINLKK